MKSDKLFILCTSQNKSQKRYTTTKSNLFNNVRVQRTLAALQRIKMNTIFMNSENSKTSKPHFLKLKLTSKLDLRICEKGYCLIKP